MSLTKLMKKPATFLIPLIAFTTPVLSANLQSIQVEHSGQILSFEYDTDRFTVTNKKNSSFSLKSRETSDTIFVQVSPSKAEKELGFEVKAKDYLHFHPSKTDVDFLHLSALKDELFESQFKKEYEKPWIDSSDAQVKAKRLKRSIYRRFSRIFMDPERSLHFVTYVGKYEPYGGEGYIYFYHLRPGIASICLPDNTAEYGAFIKSMKLIDPSHPSEEVMNNDEGEAQLETEEKTTEVLETNEF